MINHGNGQKGACERFAGAPDRLRDQSRGCGFARGFRRFARGLRGVAAGDLKFETRNLKVRVSDLRSLISDLRLRWYGLLLRFKRCELQRQTTNLKPSLNFIVPIEP